MSNETRSLLESAVNPGRPASRRVGARGILEDCWVPLRDAIEPKLTDVMLEALGPLARAQDADEARPAKAVLSRDRVFVQAFSTALHSEFKAAVNDFVNQASAAAAAAPAPKSLSLIEFGVMEFSTAIETGSNRIRNAVDDTYSSVKQRLANLVKELELRDSENPFRPAVVLRATYAALKAVETKDEHLLPLLQLFEPALIAPVSQAYAAIDRHFASKGVSSDIARSTLTRNTVIGGGRTTQIGRSTGLGASTGFGGPHTTGPHFASGVNAETMLQAMYQRMHLIPGMGGMPPLPPAAAVGAPQFDSGGRYLPAPTIGAPSGLMPMPMLGGMGAGGAGVLIDAGLLSAINEIQKLGAMALAAVQQGMPSPDAAIDSARLRTALVEKAPKQVDKLTIEIVGLLFDRVNRDRHVPQAIKELLQRLQFPLIKVALTDPDLFASGDHPARQLIDRIASTSIGWTGEGEENARYLSEVQKAIHGVLSAEEDTAPAFENARNTFEQYLTEERTRDDDPVTRAKRALEEAENREIMAINATIRIRSAFDGVQIESYLREFLLETWPRVLVAVSLRDKTSEEKHAGVKTYMSIVPDLVWSVQPKINPEDRKRLVGTIPPVLNILRRGLTLIDWPKERMQHFFSRLMNSHAVAVKALELAHGAAVPAFQASTMRIKLDGIDLSGANLASGGGIGSMRVPDEVVKRMLEEHDARVVHVPAPVERAIAADVDLDEAGAAQVLALMKRGQWYTLQRGDVGERVQLRWVSPHKTLYLFTPAHGTSAHSLSPDGITGMLLSGKLRPVESAPLFQRAVNDVLHDLQGASGSGVPEPVPA